MELLPSKQMLTIALLSLSVIACGGGGSASSQSDQVEEPIPEFPEIFGEQKSKKTSGFIYPTNSISMYDSSVCRNYDAYYETENVLVFGNSGTSKELFERFATWTEFGLQELKRQMGVDLIAFQQRYPFSLETYLVATDYLYERLNEGGGETLFMQVTGDELPTFYQDLTTGTSKRHYLYQQIRHLNPEQINNLIALVQAHYLPSELSTSFGQTLPGKSLVCLNTAFNNSNLWATGNLVGYTARTNDSRPSSAYIVTHELMHTLQHQYLTYLSQVDRWFLEGSAEYAMGHIASPSSHNQRDPLDDKWESTLGAVAYGHYNIAVSYLEATSPGFIINVLKHIADNGVYHVVDYAEYPEYQYDRINQPNPDFRNAFNAYAKRPDGSALTYQDFESEYHQLIDQWIAQTPSSLMRKSTQKLEQKDWFELQR
ncbi:hypothetical protein OAG1_38380 [Agarivorans sp. OAG1]|uniref:hypothetical protein n=1 Tax=Agarivorans sp. OAG1 TaxID=3082387 RepID=UPI002B2CC355|nr:hypothetical protein OAG1_38380 [Agarivorans sp. OAG1]